MKRHSACLWIQLLQSNFFKELFRSSGTILEILIDWYLCNTELEVKFPYIYTCIIIYTYVNIEFLRGILYIYT